MIIGIEIRLCRDPYGQAVCEVRGHSPDTRSSRGKILEKILAGIPDRGYDAHSCYGDSFHLGIPALIWDVLLDRQPLNDADHILQGIERYFAIGDLDIKFLFK